MVKAIAAYLPQSAVHELVASYGLPAIMPNTIVPEDKLFPELEQIRKMGYALDNREIVEGARCLAAPVFDLHGHPLGAISLSGAAHRFAADKVPEIAVHLREAAAVASRKLGFVQGP